MNYFKVAIKEFPRSTIFQIMLVFIFVIPPIYKINGAIFSWWCNPLWEEIVFRGIPLIILWCVKKKLSANGYKYAKILYILLPSIAFVAYHIPNHGTSRIVDIFITGCIFSYLALKYSFLAPLVLHYMFDANDILYLSNISYIQLPKNIGLLSNISDILIKCMLVSIPFIIACNIINLKKRKNTYKSLRKLKFKL